MNVLALLLVTVVLSTVTLQPPTPTPGERSEGQQNTDTERERQPSYEPNASGGIATLVAPQASSKTSGGADRIEGDSTERRLEASDIANIILASVALLALILQGISMERHRSLERPWVAIEIGEKFGFVDLHKMRVDPMFCAALSDDFSYQVGVAVTFHNGGRSVARLRNIISELYPFVTPGLPPLPDEWVATDDPEVLLAPGGKVERLAAWRLHKDELSEFIAPSSDLERRFVLCCATTYELPAGWFPWRRQAPAKSRLCMVNVTEYDRHECEWRTRFDFVGGDTYNHYT